MFELPGGLSGISDSRSGAAVVDRFLDEELRLPRAVLEAVVRAGVTERRRADDFHPVNAGGVFDWLGRVHKLRHALREQGWALSNPQGAPYIQRDDGALLLGVMQGNDATGNLDKDLKSAYPRGVVLAKLTRNNDRKPGLFEVEPADEEADSDMAKVWIFATHFLPKRDDKPARVLLEVSHPEPTSGGQFITRWAWRCCLDPFEFPEIGPDVSGDPPDLLDVQVAAR